MKNKFKIVSIIALSIFCFHVVCGVANANNQIPVEKNMPLRLKKDSRALVVYTHEKQLNDGVLKARITALLEVNRVVESGFTASWTTESVRIGDEYIDKSHPRAVDMLIGVPIQYDADMDGKPLRIKNSSALIDKVSKNGLFAREEKKTAQYMSEFLKNQPDGLLAPMLLKIPAFLSVCQGTNLYLGVESESEIYVSSPFDGNSVLASQSYLLSSFNDKRSQATIEYRLEFDPESIGNATAIGIGRNSVNHLFPLSEMKKIKVVRRDAASCTVNVKNGWVERMRYGIFTKVNGDKEMEKFKISVKFLQ